MILRCLEKGTLIYHSPCLKHVEQFLAADEATAFMEVLSKSPQFKVLTILAQKPQEELTKTEIAQRAGIGRTTLYRVWSDLERMKAISPSRHVGAVTLYRMNQQSPVVQSFLNITRSLTTVTDAVARIEQLRKLQESARTEFGEATPAGPSVLVKLLRENAISPDAAKPRGTLQFSSAEGESLKGLMSAGLVFENSGSYYLSQLGNQTAQGAAKIWSSENSTQSVDQAISTARVALNLINQEIRKLKGQVK
jgi:Fe2+ or Zn2+ uptake regulation protein